MKGIVNLLPTEWPADGIGTPFASPPAELTGASTQQISLDLLRGEEAFEVVAQYAEESEEERVVFQKALVTHSRFLEWYHRERQSYHDLAETLAYQGEAGNFVNNVRGSAVRKIKQECMDRKVILAKQGGEYSLRLATFCRSNLPPGQALYICGDVYQFDSGVLVGHLGRNDVALANQESTEELTKQMREAHRLKPTERIRPAEPQQWYKFVRNLDLISKFASFTVS